MDEQNRSAHHTEPAQVDYERIDSPQPLAVNKQAGPFRISLLEMPLDLGSAEKGGELTEDNGSGHSLQHMNKQNRRSAKNLNSSYLI